jgi:ribosome biogenesis GTPase A
MGKNYWKVVNGVIAEADILLEIIDARNVEKTRNIEIENKVDRSGKILIYVLNKCDLADRDEVEKLKKTLDPAVFISCKDYHGMSLLKERIIIEAKRIGLQKPMVGILGYPNVGKSSVINALSSSGKARASSTAGFTHGKQYVTSRHFYLIDTPGVIPYGEKDSVENAMIGVKTNSKDPESDLLIIMQEHPGIIESHYNVSIEDDKEETLEKIAIKLKCIRKGNLPDTTRASEIILKGLREGKIRV